MLLSGGAQRPTATALVSLLALLALGVWTAVSLTWSPLPSLARDEALLVAYFTIALALPVLVLRGHEGRLAILGLLVAAVFALAVATALNLVLADSPDDQYDSGRIYAPIGYANAQATIFLFAFWPAVVFAARRSLPSVPRALALAAAVSFLANWLLTQSKGGIVALAVSAVAFFALAPQRLRALAPTLVAGAFVAAAYYPLTGPFRAGDEAEADAIRTAGRATLVLVAAAAVLGLVYAFVDRRLTVPRPAHRVAGAVAVLALVAVVAGGAAGFLAAVDSPRAYVAEKWDDLQASPTEERGSSHLVNLGSFRTDYWRVALDEFEDHPVAGIGAGGFGPAYLEKGRSLETPTRAHSVELDVLGETGAVGFVLFVAALAPAFLVMARRARLDLAWTGLLAACLYWLLHASVDVVWTFPVLGVPFFLLVGTALSRDGERRVPARAGLAPALLAVALLVLAFVPPWLAAKFTERAVASGGAAADRDLDRARRLDPLSVDPLVVESALADSLPNRVRPLREAIEIEPRSSRLYYALGAAYLDAGKRRQARQAFLRAHELDPRAELIREKLAETRRRGGAT